MLTAITAIFIFLVVILVHELGHFLVAKAVGIKVNEFSIGMGPLIKEFEKGETKYSFRLLPIGGYVAMEGEDEDSNDPNSFTNAETWKKLLVIGAGAFMNFILAIVVFTIVTISVGIPTTTIGNIMESSPALNSSLEKGDKILEIDGVIINEWEDISNNINKVKPGEEIKLKIEKEDKEVEEIEIEAMDYEGRAIIGVEPTREKSFTKSLSTGFKQTYYLVIAMFQFIKSLFQGKVGTENLAGPVGVISQIGEVSKIGIIPVLTLLGVISVNLGFFNLLPIPALDGGRIFFLIIELFTGKSLDPEKEGLIHFIGFVLLISLMIFVTYKDIIRLIFKG